MMKKVVWNEVLDARLRQLRNDGVSWESVAQTLGFDRAVCQRHAKEIGLSTARVNTANEQQKLVAVRRAHRRL